MLINWHTISPFSGANILIHFWCEKTTIDKIKGRVSQLRCASSNWRFEPATLPFWRPSWFRQGIFSRLIILRRIYREYTTKKRIPSSSKLICLLFNEFVHLLLPWTSRTSEFDTNLHLRFPGFYQTPLLPSTKKFVEKASQTE